MLPLMEVLSDTGGEIPSGGSQHMHQAPILARGSAFRVLDEVCTAEPEGSATHGYGSKSPEVHRARREPC